MTGRYCPECVQAMTSGRLGPLRFDLCLNCGGVWLARGDLAKLNTGGSSAVWRLVEAARASRRGGASYPDRPLNCPDCGLDMDPTSLDGAPGIAWRRCSICIGEWVPIDALSRYAAEIGAREGTAKTEPVKLSRPSIPDPVELHTRPAEGKAPWEAGIGKDNEPCAKCGSMNRRHTPVCWSCGTLLQGRIVGTCPSCEHSFHALDSEGVEIAACSGCGGVWLTHGQLAALMMQSGVHQDRLVAAIKKVRVAGEVHVNDTLYCPTCRLIMFAVPLGMFSTEPAATCPQCDGTFIEHDNIVGVLGGS